MSGTETGGSRTRVRSSSVGACPQLPGIQTGKLQHLQLGCGDEGTADSGKRKSKFILDICEFKS